VTTTTGDSEGATVSTSPVALRRSEIERVLARFTGEIDQVPPMFSAIKHQGRPLYKLAREGLVVPRNPRRVWIRSIDMLRFEGEILEIAVVCGKGTYIRVLAEDIGHALGCGASLDALRRTGVGKLTIQESVCLEVLEAESSSKRAERLLAVDAQMEVLPRVDLDPAQAQCLIHGRAVEHGISGTVGLVRLYDAPSGRFLGVGIRDTSGSIMPRRLMAPPEKASIA
jgi:tRNA pseudouridine55 synthase